MSIFVSSKWLRLVVFLSILTTVGCSGESEDSTSEALNPIGTTPPESGDDNTTDDGNDNNDGEDASGGDGNDNGTGDDNETPPDGGGANDDPEAGGGEGDGTNPDDGEEPAPGETPPPGTPNIGANETSRDIFRKYVYEVSKANCASCHGQQVVGTDPKITLLILTNGYPVEAHDATASVVNFVTVENSPLLSAITAPGGHPAGSPSISEEKGQEVAAQYLPLLEAWRDARNREAAEANSIPGPEEGDLAVGQTQYGQQCAGCHGAAANGNQLGDGETYASVFGFAAGTHQGNTCDRQCANNVAAYLCLNVWQNVASQCTDLVEAANVTNAILPTHQAFDFAVTDLLGVSPVEHYGSSLVAQYYALDKVYPEYIEGAAVSAVKKAVESDLVNAECTDSKGESSCIASFIASFGERAFGRKLTQTEFVDYMGYFYAVSSSSDDQMAIELTIARFIKSENFLNQIQ
ncbi:MAG: hypothetical protein AAGB12_12035 [Pseudomonadota bacterium]